MEVEHGMASLEDPECPLCVSCVCQPQKHLERLMPAISTCMEEMKLDRDRLFRNTVAVNGYSGLDIAYSNDLGLADSRVVVFHLDSNSPPTLFSVFTVKWFPVQTAKH